MKNLENVASNNEKLFLDIASNVSVIMDQI